MKHTTVYMGRLSMNFDGLSSKTTHYKKPDGTKAPHVRPTHPVNGLEFGVMDEPGRGPFAVSVGRVILDVPLRVDLPRHLDGKGHGPGQTQFGDESARRLVADAIRLNPQKAEEILEHVWTTVATARPLAREAGQ